MYSANKSSYSKNIEKNKDTLSCDFPPKQYSQYSQNPTKNGPNLMSYLEGKSQMAPMIQIFFCFPGLKAIIESEARHGAGAKARISCSKPEVLSLNPDFPVSNYFEAFELSFVIEGIRQFWGGCIGECQKNSL